MPRLASSVLPKGRLQRCVYIWYYIILINIVQDFKVFLSKWPVETFSSMVCRRCLKCPMPNIAKHSPMMSMWWCNSTWESGRSTPFASNADKCWNILTGHNSRPFTSHVQGHNPVNDRDWTSALGWWPMMKHKRWAGTKPRHTFKTANTRCVSTTSFDSSEAAGRTWFPWAYVSLV